ncbi:MAG: CoA transferase, partial [Gammaproteobacteria bacterium]|nr:CoA transferase [Gammaproteobacteria bacterium]
MAQEFALSGMTVVDIGVRPSTAWCSRLLADFGAEVIMVEPDGGHPLRAHPPFDDAGRSIPSRYFLANKASGSRDLRDTLIESADIIVTSSLEGAVLARRNAGAIVCAITPHGQDGAYKDFPGNDLTAAARSGWAYVNGLKSRAPLKGSGYQASFQAGTLAYGAIVCAMIERLANGAEGQLIDISELETLVSTSAPASLRVQYSGFVWPRREKVDMNEGPVPVADGYFALPLSRPDFWRKAMQVFELPDLAEDKELQQPGLRHKFKDRYVERVHEKMLGWRRMELFKALGDLRVVAGPVLRMDEMGENPQFDGRDFFVRPASGPAGSPPGSQSGSNVRFPGAFAHMGYSDWSLNHEMPEVGVRREPFAAGEVSTTPVRAGGVRAGTVIARGKGPLSGFRGLVLTQAWAG